MSDFDDLFSALRSERGVNRESVISAAEAALLAAYKTGPNAGDYARAIFDPATDTMTIQRLRDLHAGELPRPGIDVVDGPNGREIAVVLWDELPAEEFETIVLDPQQFGRVAANAAKDALRSEVRGSAQLVIYGRYRSRIGEVVEGVVDEAISSGVLVQLEDAEAIIPSTDRLPGPPPRRGDRIAAVIMHVAEQSSGAQITLSQTDPGFVKAIFAGEISEVRDGRIELVRVARVPGVRTKVAVATRSNERGAASPIGICVGERGSRIRLMRDLLGEEIDLLAFDPDPLSFVAAALHPAKPRRVEETDAGYAAIMTEDERAKVAGADGLGLRLASELVGSPIELRIDAPAVDGDGRPEAVAGTCAYIRPNNRQCVNLAEPGSLYCGLPTHHAAA
jgi:N utilization substance protein A